VLESNIQSGVQQVYM